MNFLAHFYLSSESEDDLIGSFLGDFHKGSVQSLPERFRPGVVRHRRIDAMTDVHPATRRSRGRLRPWCGHYSGLIVDVFYDHFLAADWDDYSGTSLSTFVQQTYDALLRYESVLPRTGRWVARRMREDDWLTSYRQISGIRTALERMSGRLKRPFPLESTLPLLQNDYDYFRSDFRELMRDLRRV